MEGGGGYRGAGNATKERFAPATNGTGAHSKLGQFTSWRCNGNTAQWAAMSMFIPHDFKSISEFVIMVIPLGNFGFQVDMNWAASSELYTTGSGIILPAGLIAPLNIVTEIDISGVLGGIAAKDYLGIVITDRGVPGDSNFHVIGSRLLYV